MVAVVPRASAHADEGAEQNAGVGLVRACRVDAVDAANEAGRRASASRRGLAAASPGVEAIAALPNARPAQQ